MKKTLNFGLALAIGLVSAMPAKAGAVLDHIRSSGELRVGTTGDYKPFTFRNPDGSYHGADIDMAGRLAKSLGVKLVIIQTVWAKLQDDFTAGKFDIAMGGVTILPPRLEKGPFTPPTFIDGKRPIARCADRDKYVSIAAINRPEVRVIVNPGAANEQFARANFTQAQLTVHADNVTVFDQIAQGKADLMVTDGIEVDHQALINKGVLCPTAVPAPFTRLEQAYWMQKDDAFVAAVNAWFDGEVKSGAWQKTLETALQAP
jgi:cyclohexadienyl dehydratase